MARRRMKSGGTPHTQSAVEVIFQEELARPDAAAAESDVGINRAYRRTVLYALTSALKGKPLDAGVLAAIVRAAELHALTMALLFHQGASLTFLHVDDIGTFVRWCYAFFSQTAMSAPSMPAPRGAPGAFLTTLQANAAEARQFIEHIDHSARYVEDEGMPEGAEAEDGACCAGVAISRQTFVVLANALMSVARAWLPEPAFREFSDAYNAGLVELHDLRVMLPCNECEAAPPTQETPP